MIEKVVEIGYALRGLRKAYRRARKTKNSVWRGSFLRGHEIEILVKPNDYIGCMRFLGSCFLLPLLAGPGS